jgi:M61 glycyl aminopeptidase
MPCLWRRISLQLVIVAALAGAGRLGAQSNVHALDILLKPHEANGAIDYINVTINLESPGAAAGATLVHIPSTIVSRQGIDLKLVDIEATDSKGVLPLKEVAGSSTSTATYRDFRPQRPTSGDVTIQYPARVSMTGHNGPLFDLLGQDGGANGAGVSFLTLPDSHQPYKINIHWDLSQLPAGSRGVTSRGEGTVSLTGPPDTAAYCFYYVGSVHSFTPSGSDVTLYWLTQPPFDAQAIAASLSRLYQYETKFFASTDIAYRVFLRANPFAASGGTAQPQSFMLGYSKTFNGNASPYQALLAHEMTHNWPVLSGEHVNTAWYTEGTAEYYSLLLSFRDGIISLDQFTQQINRRIASYLSNPLHTVGSTAAGEAFWRDSRAQAIPYGRGLLYLINTNQRIRKATHGEKSLDSVVLWVLAQQRSGKDVGNSEWVDKVGSLIGKDQAKADFFAMMNGSLSTALSGAFLPCLRMIPRQIHVYDLGFSPQSLNTHVLKGLEPDSQAARTGLREGDEIMSTSDTYSAQGSESQHLTVTVRRDGSLQTFDYVPRSAQAIDAFEWQRERDIPLKECAF